MESQRNDPAKNPVSFETRQRVELHVYIKKTIKQTVYILTLSQSCSSGNVQRYSGDIYISVYFRKKYHLISVVNAGPPGTRTRT